MNKPDIHVREDLVKLVDSFYDKVKVDPLLAGAFSHVNWPVHLPVMYNFWSSVMLGEQSYSGNPLMRHIDLPIDQKHFAQWLVLFTETVDEHFAGEMAEAIKQRAQSIATIFQLKMGLTKR